MFEDTASAKELVIVIGMEIVLGKDGLLLSVLGVGLVEGVEFFTNDCLGREVVGVGM